MAKAPIMISIEGNIGSGKSTFLAYLKEHLKIECGRVAFIPEPVDAWNKICDENGTSIIENYYADQKKHAFAFQMMAYVSRLNLIKESLSHDYDVIIMERSLRTDRFVFAQMLRDDGMITKIEFDIYTTWFNAFLKEIPEPKVVYLQTTPEVALCRVNTRARQGETIPIEYMTKCHLYHQEWRNVTETDISNNQKWLILDANQEATTSLFSKWTNEVMREIQIHRAELLSSSR